MIFTRYNRVRAVRYLFLKQGRIHGVISRKLLGRGRNKAVYTLRDARRIITDRLQRQKSLIVLIWVVSARAGPTDIMTYKIASSD